MARILVIIAFALLVASTTSVAQMRDYAIALHVQDYEADCTLRLPNCWAITTSCCVTDMPIYVFVMVCGHGWAPGSDGFTAAWYGITWPAEWVFLSWTSCADWTVGAIQRPGDFVEQHWLTCVPPSGFPVTVGVLALMPTSPGIVSVIPHGTANVARVDDCHGTTDIVLPCTVGNGRAGWVTVCMFSPGCNPCPCVGPPCYEVPSATEPNTWGAIKSLYK